MKIEVKPVAENESEPHLIPHLTTAEVRARYRLSHVGLWKMIRDGNFPDPIRVGRRTLWSVEVLKVLDDGRFTPKIRPGPPKRTPRAGRKAA